MKFYEFYKIEICLNNIRIEHKILNALAMLEGRKINSFL